MAPNESTEEFHPPTKKNRYSKIKQQPNLFRSENEEKEGKMSQSLWEFTTRMAAKMRDLSFCVS